MAWWMSTDQKLVVEFVKKTSIGITWGNPIPACIENKTHRLEVAEFTDRLLKGQTCYVPDGLGFLGKITWRKMLEEYHAKGA